MSRSRMRAGLSVGIACVFLLLLPLASPVMVEARWNPRIGNSLPRDPGTPFEEPENRDPEVAPDTRDGNPTVPEGPQSLAPVIEVAKSTPRTPWRLLLQRLVLAFWHLQ